MTEPTANPRAEEQELLQKVQAGLRDPAITSLLRLLEIRVLRCQNRMLDCPYEEFPALQAEAKAIAKLIKDIRPTHV